MTDIKTLAYQYGKCAEWVDREQTIVCLRDYPHDGACGFPMAHVKNTEPGCDHGVPYWTGSCPLCIQEGQALNHGSRGSLDFTEWLTIVITILAFIGVLWLGLAQ